MNPLFDPVFGGATAAESLGAQAWLDALCEVEAALAAACASVGLLDRQTAEQVRAACDPAGITLPPQQIAAGGNPVIPLVALLRERAGTAAGAVHLGATSQDVLDTASMLLARRLLGPILTELHGCAELCAELARTHRATPMIGRTLLQQAEPTTFGALAAGWTAGLDRAHHRLHEVADGLPVQLGGAAGTLAAWWPHGTALRAAFAQQLRLADPGLTWHTDRSRITELAGALGVAAAAVAKPATDIVLLSQTELAELAEAAPGGSSSMPHKRNPIAAATARAAAAQAPGLVATLLSAAAAELQRGAGPWHAEWPALQGLHAAVSGCTQRLHAALDGLQVNAAAMLANLAGRSTDTEVAAAAEQVQNFLEGRGNG